MPVARIDVDVATLAFLAGSAANGQLLERIRDAGHPYLRTAHGYVFQRLLKTTPTVGELATALGVTQQAASKSAKELESLGYVRRHPDASDRRATRLELTERGHDAVEVARRIRRELESQLRARVGAEVLDNAKESLWALLAMAGGEADIHARSVRMPSS